MLFEVHIAEEFSLVVQIGKTRFRVFEPTPNKGNVKVPTKGRLQVACECSGRFETWLLEFELCRTAADTVEPFTIHLQCCGKVDFWCCPMPIALTQLWRSRIVYTSFRLQKGWNTTYEWSFLKHYTGLLWPTYHIPSIQTERCSILRLSSISTFTSTSTTGRLFEPKHT